MALASAGTPILINKMKVQSIGKQLFTIAPGAADRVLVIIRLNGGNDGLNTVIPLDQYSNLSIQRNNVLIPQGSVLPLTANVGLHPVMGGMQNMFNNGNLGIIQNVGYPDQNRSHFRSMDIWSSGLIDAPATTGWLGRWMDNEFPNYPDAYPNASYPDPFAISMGYEVSSTCQGLMANFSHAVNDPFTNYNLTSSSVLNDGSYYGSHVEYLATLIDQANEYGGAINAAANAGNTMSTLYDPNNPLATQLQYVAQMISGGLQTKVYILNVNGFDTHDAQVSATDTTQGTHADLLKKVSDALEAFMDDCNLLGIAPRIAGMTFSEFGRQVASNASRGTDHGDAAPLFLWGTCITNNIMGSNPVIGNTIVNQEGIPMQYDFRDIYASILKDWFGVSSLDIQSLFEHTVTFYPILDACNNLGLEEDEMDKNEALIYPNPCYTNSTVRFTSEAEWVKIDIFDMTGKRVMKVMDGNVSQGRQDVFMETRDLRAGDYIVLVRKESGEIRTPLIKVQ